MKWLNDMLRKIATLYKVEDDCAEQQMIAAQQMPIPPVETGVQDAYVDNHTDVTYIADGDFEKLLSNTIDTIRYYDQIAEQTTKQDVKMVLNDVCLKLIENLILSGCQPIDSPQGVFDMTRHKIVPFQIVPDGTMYKSLIRSGIEYNGEVRLLAIVEL